METVRLKGISITRKVLQERYDISLTDLEWKFFGDYITKSWESKEFELERIINKHVTNSLIKVGYMMELDGTEVKMNKKKPID